MFCEEMKTTWEDYEIAKERKEKMTQEKVYVHGKKLYKGIQTRRGKN